MKIVNEFIGRTQSATDSATVALNATQEAYVYLEAQRKGTLGTLLNQAVKNLETAGAGPQEALNMVAMRGQYLKELSRGQKMFYQATADISRDSNAFVVPGKLV